MQTPVPGFWCIQEAAGREGRPQRYGDLHPTQNIRVKSQRSGTQGGKCVKERCPLSSGESAFQWMALDKRVESAKCSCILQHSLATIICQAL